MEQEKAKSFLKQTEKIFKEFGVKAGKIAKALEKETKIGMVKVEQMTLESEKNKLMLQLGKKVYPLLKKKEITHKSLNEQIKKISAMEDKIRGKKSSITKIRKKKTATTKKK